MAKNNANAHLKDIRRAERAINDAFTTGKVERSKITRMAQLDAAEAVARAGEAMEADEVADEAMRMMIIVERGGDREKIKVARTREREARKNANELHAAATKSAKQAYDAIRFSAPNKMGFMRAVQIAFAAHIAYTLILLMLTHRDNFTYNVGSVMDWVMIILEGMAFWMFVNRYKIARPFTIGMAAVGLVVPALSDLIAHGFNLSLFAIDGAFYIFLILYFSLSKRVKATLVNDLSKYRGTFEPEDFIVDRIGWPFVRNLGIYFVAFSILGHWMEMAMCQLIIAGLVEGEYDPTNTILWRDWLYPFPMEGIAVVLIALLLYPLFTWLKRRFDNKYVPYVLSFVANALTCSIIEFTMGIFCNADRQLWDYSKMPFNIMGQVCLQNALAFGVACSVIAWWVYPMLERQLARVPRDIMNIVFVGVLVFGGITFGLYLYEPPAHITDFTDRIAATVTQRVEANGLSVDLLLERRAQKELRKDLEDATSLTDEERAELERQLDAIDESLAAIEAQLAAA